MFMDCMKEINANKQWSTFAYADDVAVICNSEQQLQEAGNIWNEVMS
jgi:hypothetical protein